MRTSTLKDLFPRASQRVFPTFLGRLSPTAERPDCFRTAFAVDRHRAWNPAENNPAESGTYRLTALAANALGRSRSDLPSRSADLSPGHSNEIISAF
jgi:hypothetical protein